MYVFNPFKLMTDKGYLKKIFLFYVSIVLLLTWIPSVLAGGLHEPHETGALGDVSWYIKEQGGKVFYLTHGTAVWGHEFGFYKRPGDCEEDILWLTLSSSDEKVKNFVGAEVAVSLKIDEVTYEVELKMLFAGTIGFTHVMYFSNWLAGEKLIDALTSGQNVTIQIIKPTELTELLDIKYDTFNLKGYVASKEEAMRICKNVFLEEKSVE
jgi:hypothetical protein